MWAEFFLNNRWFGKLLWRRILAKSCMFFFLKFTRFFLDECHLITTWDAMTSSFRYAKHWREEYRQALSLAQNPKHESSAVSSLTASTVDILVGDPSDMNNGMGSSNNTKQSSAKSKPSSSVGGNSATLMFWSHSYMLQSELETFLNDDKKVGAHLLHPRCFLGFRALLIHQSQDLRVIDVAKE